MGDRVFVDTWGWVALGHKKDSRHMEIVRHYREINRQGGRIYTSDYVLDELITLLFRRENRAEALVFIEGIFSSSKQGHLKIEKITPDHFDQAWELRRRFKEKPLISFTDLTSMVLMNELGIKNILTEDQHFFKVGMGFRKIP
jgi:uncharacterized protein